MIAPRIAVQSLAFCALLIIASGCTTDTPTGPGVPTAEGAWALVQVDTVSGPDTTTMFTFATGSSVRYLEISGSSVIDYLLDTTLVQDQASLQIGSYTSATDALISGGETYTLLLSGVELTLEYQDPGSGQLTLLHFQRYAGDVPPGTWPGYLSSVGDDTYEPDDSPASATVLVAGAGPQLHTIDPIDQDWLTFSATGGRVYTVSVVAEGASVTVLDESGLVELDWGYAQEGYPATIVVTPAAGQTYTVLIEGMALPGIYTVELTEVSPTQSPFSGTWYLASSHMEYRDPDTSFIIDTSFTVTTTPQIIEFDNQQITAHMYFEGRYDVQVTTFLYLGNDWALIDGDSAQVSLNGGLFVLSFSGGGGGMSQSMVARFGRYTGEVPPAAWLTGPPVPSQAVSVTVGANPQAAYLTAGGADWYSFVPSGTGQLTVSTQGSTVDTYMDLYMLNNDNLVAVDSDDDSGADLNASITFTPQAGATYYARVTGFDSFEEGGYSFSVVPAGILPKTVRSASPERSTVSPAGLLQLVHGLGARRHRWPERE